MSSSIVAPAAAVDCGLRAFGVIEADAEAIAGLRQKPGPPLRQRLSPVLLKHSDEQTVAGLAAVLAAIERFGMKEVDFTSWGVVAAPRWLGRLRLVGGLHKFHRKGAGAASPMIVPHLSLHAVSGTISQVLGSHGLNFGVSSGPDNLAEGLLAAACVLSSGQLPGLWLVLTCWSPEPAPDDEGRPAAPAVCRGVALALQRAGDDWSGPRLCVEAAPRTACGPSGGLAELAAFLTRGEGGSWGCALSGGGWAELTGPLPGETGS